MLLDPFTVVAQVVNFLILVVALKYVLFDRIVGAIDVREQEITSRLESARTREEEAEQRADELRKARHDLDERRERLLAEARAEVADRRASMLDDARHELDERRSHWERALRQEHERALRDFDRRVADGMFELVRDALGRLANDDLERRVVDVAFDRFAADGVVAGEFGTATDRTMDRIEVATSFELGADGRRRVRERLAALGVVAREDDGPIVFRRDPALVLGVRLRAAAVSVEWSADDYLDRLRSAVEAGRPATDQDPIDG